MSYEIIINDNNTQHFSKIISDINCREYVWTILDFEAVGYSGDNFSMLDEMDNINDSAHGVEYSVEKLNFLIGKTFQVINMVLIGNKSPTQIIRFDDYRDKYVNHDIVIEMFDSSYWSINTNDKQISKKMEQYADDVKNNRIKFEEPVSHTGQKRRGGAEEM